MPTRADDQGPDHRVIVIGAGFAGLGAAIRLKQAGIDDFVVLDRADDIGGTWRDNVYPGVACDVPVLAYEYSFEPNPDWSQFYAPGDEIQAYALRCVEKFALRPHFRPSTEVQALRFDAEHDRWSVETSRGTLTARFVFYAPGVLSIPKLPALPRLECFEGAVCHTAALDGRRRVGRASSRHRRHWRLGDAGDPQGGAGGRTPPRLPAHADLGLAARQSALSSLDAHDVSAGSGDAKRSPVACPGELGGVHTRHGHPVPAHAMVGSADGARGRLEPPPAGR